MASRDGLLWIGDSYDVFDCHAQPACAAEGSCFVHEAACWGISHQLDAVPEWAVPGETRIFVADRAALTRDDLGMIHGYFELQRIEVVDDTGSRTAGVWQPPCPSTEDLDQVMDAIIDHLWDHPGDRHALTLAPLAAERLIVDQSSADGPDAYRYGWRESSGAVFAVDALRGDLTDAWAELVRCSSAPDFGRLVERLHEPGPATARPAPRQPSGLPAMRRGSLVVFNQPATWQAFPQVATNQMIRIDGDHLLDQLAEGVARVKVRRHAPSGTRRAAEAELACECGVNLDLAQRFVTKLLDLGYRLSRVEKYRFVQDEIAEARVWIRNADPFPLERLVSAVELGESQFAGHHVQLREKCEAMLEVLAEPAAGSVPV